MDHAHERREARHPQRGKAREPKLQSDQPEIPLRERPRAHHQGRDRGDPGEPRHVPRQARHDAEGWGGLHEESKQIDRKEDRHNVNQDQQSHARPRIVICSHKHFIANQPGREPRRQGQHGGWPQGPLADRHDQGQGRERERGREGRGVRPAQRAEPPGGDDRQGHPRKQGLPVDRPPLPQRVTDHREESRQPSARKAQTGGRRRNAPPRAHRQGQGDRSASTRQNGCMRQSCLVAIPDRGDQEADRGQRHGEGDPEQVARRDQRDEIDEESHHRGDREGREDQADVHQGIDIWTGAALSVTSGLAANGHERQHRAHDLVEQRNKGRPRRQPHRVDRSPRAGRDQLDREQRRHRGAPNGRVGERFPRRFQADQHVQTAKQPERGNGRPRGRPPRKGRPRREHQGHRRDPPRRVHDRHAERRGDPGRSQHAMRDPEQQPRDRDRERPRTGGGVAQKCGCAQDRTRECEAGEVDERRVREDPRGDDRADRVAAHHDHSGQGLEPRQDARPDRERHADQATMASQQDIVPSPSEEQGQGREQDVEGQSAERPERDRQLRAVAQSPGDQALHQSEIIFDEDVRAKTCKDQRRQGRVQERRLPLFFKGARIQPHPHDRRREGVPAGERSEVRGPRQPERERQGRHGVGRHLEQGHRPIGPPRRLQSVGDPHRRGRRDHRREREERRGQVQHVHADPAHRAGEVEREQPEREVGGIVVRVRIRVLLASDPERPSQPLGRRRIRARRREHRRQPHRHRDRARGERVDHAHGDQRQGGGPSARDPQRSAHDPRQPHHRGRVDHEHGQARGRRSSQPRKLPHEGEADRQDDQGREPHNAPGADRAPARQPPPERREHQRICGGEQALPLGHPEPITKHHRRADGRADHDQEDRDRQDQLLPVVLQELPGDLGPTGDRDEGSGRGSGGDGLRRWGFLIRNHEVICCRRLRSGSLLADSRAPA